MKKLMLGAFLAAAFVSLTGFKGAVEVNEPMNFDKARKGRKSVEVGTYDVVLARKSKNKMSMEIGLGGRDNNTVLDIKFPNGKNLDQLDGDFVLAPEESSQNYWLVGHYAQESNRGKVRWGEQRCSLQVRERYCWVDGRGYRQCGIRWVTRYGYQDVRYYDVETVTELSLDFKSAQDAQTVSASVVAEDTDLKRVVSEAGPCRLY